MKYDFTAIEAKWHKIWEEKKLYVAETGSDREKFYALIEFPYPSGAGCTWAMRGPIPPWI